MFLNRVRRSPLSGSHSVLSTNTACWIVFKCINIQLIHLSSFVSYFVTLFIYSWVRISKVKQHLLNFSKKSFYCLSEVFLASICLEGWWLKGKSTYNTMFFVQNCKYIYFFLLISNKNKGTLSIGCANKETYQNESQIKMSLSILKTVSTTAFDWC